MSLSLFKKKNSYETLLLVDLRSASVGASLILFSETEKPRIVYTVRKNILFKDPLEADVFIDTMFKTLREVLTEAHSSGIRKLAEHKADIPSHIQVVYSSPWFTSTIKEMNLKQDKPFNFTQDYFAKLIKQQATPPETGVLIEKDITRVVINGYEITNPFNKKVNEILFSMYLSTISKESKHSVEETIQNIFHIKNITHRTFPLITFTTLRNLFVNISSFIFIDIGGEVSDIGIVENNNLTHTVSMPNGYSTFIRTLMSEFKCSNFEAVSYIENYDFTNATALSADKRQIFERLMKDWVQTFSQTMSESALIFPRNIFISVHKPYANFFAQIFKENLFDTDNDPKTLSINLALLDHILLNDHLVYDSDVIKDAPMELETVFLETALKSDYNR